MRGAYVRFLMLGAVLAGGLVSGAPLWGQSGGQPLGGRSGGFAGGVGRPAEPVVSVTSQFTAPAGNQQARLFITATIKPGWHIYSITQAPGGPVATRIELARSGPYRLVGDFQAVPPPDREAKSSFGGLVVETHRGIVTWHASVELAPGVDPATIAMQGTMRVQPCDAKSCQPPQEFPFTATLGPGLALPSYARPGEAAPPEGGATPGEPGRAPPAEGPRFQPEHIQPEEVVEATSLLTALLFAFGGGLILNVMPCVLPVVGLKILTFFDQAGKSRGRAFVLNLWYALGLISVFLVLAALGVGLSEMFTERLFGIIMAAVVFAMALSLMGVWELQIPSFLGSGKSLELAEKEGGLGAFFKGIITTLLAIPCGAPLLSPALKWADEQVRAGAPADVYLAFLVIGLGMASPYLLIGAFPELLRFLPKPGAWMDTFQKAMGYLLLVAVVWILYFLPFEDVVPTIGLLFGIWLACWLIGRVPLTASGQTKLWAWWMAVLAVATSALICFPLWLRPAMQRRLERLVASQAQESPRDEAELPWQPFNRALFEQFLAAEKTVLVDFTADWCLTCKTLEALVLNTRQTREVVDRNRVVALRADWTRGAPEVTEMMQILGSKQVPVVAIFPAGNPNRPIVLRGGYTRQDLLAALERAGPSGE